MKKYLMILAGLIVGTSTLKAQNGKEFVDKLCGCFEVTFQYAETFSHQPGYKFHEREFVDGGVELSLPIEVSDNKVVIQHLLVINDTIIVKHWREEWTYENPEIWEYKGDRLWTKKMLSKDAVKGKWTQTVWEVSDEPRYQGLSQFVLLDNKIIWQNTTDAPLPRREYTAREDYNVLRRTNRLVISDNGYVHEQDNLKILRQNNSDKILVEERGLNTYKKIAAEKCNPALKYWTASMQKYWSIVRKVWNEYFTTNDKIQLKFTVDEKLLHEYILKLSYEYNRNQWSDTETENKIKNEINKFLLSNKMVAGTTN